MTLTFQKEMFGSLMVELPELWYEHWLEIASDKEVIRLDPDWTRYLHLEIAGMLHIMTARDDGILVGYYFALVQPHLHYKQSVTSWADLFYLKPEYRRGTGLGRNTNGNKLVHAAEKMLKKLGVQKSYMMTKTYADASILFKRRKYKHVENIFSKLL